MNRRKFLRRSALVLPALVVGEEALAWFDRLTHRKVFLGADFAHGADRSVTTLVELAKLREDMQLRYFAAHFARSNRLLMELPWRTA